MPVLTNARHEKFAQGLCQGLTQTAAYEAAGYKPSRFHASGLATKRHIRARVEELMARNVARQDEIASVTVASLLAEFEEARTLALKLGQPAAVVSASTAKAKLAGLWVERSERKSTGDLSAMTDAELADIVRQGEGQSKLN